MADAFGKNDRLSSGLESFTGKIIRHFVHNSASSDSDVDIFVERLLKDLNEEPAKYGAKVELQGIALRPEKLDIDFGVALRQPRIEDFEKEVDPSEVRGVGLAPHPSAFLNIEFLGMRANEIQNRVEHAVAILRLFKVGSVKWSSYRMYSESITAMAYGTLTSGYTGQALETYLVTKEDVQRLSKFWQSVGRSIPPSFFELASTKTDYLTIAYNRYSDALLQNGISERRIANSVMGLEALFLKGGEMRELVYHLRIRVSKLLGLLGYNQHEVMKTLGDAYGVRSLFVHGSQLSYKERKRLEARYKDVKNLLLSVLDYLRVSIILMMLVSKEKDEFIDLLDDSLIDTKREEQLNLTVTPAKELSWVN